MVKSRKLSIRFNRDSSAYDIAIGSGLLAATGRRARRVLGNRAAKVIVVSNPTVFRLYGDRVVESLLESGFEASAFLMKDGEVHKNIRTTEAALASFAAFGLSRTDAVLALGGGVVGDLAGFAAATYLRGISVLQVPTTLLSMIDSSTGGKTGVNSAFGKNTIGAFHQPAGVFIDTAVLKTLPARQLSAGFCEAIKHGALSGLSLLNQTGDFLSEFPMDSLATRLDEPKVRNRLAELLGEQIAFKAAVVACDETERPGRTDAGSRKILNLGHTLAHALEKVTKYRYILHGEAVGWGIRFAAALSKSLALCDEKDVELLNDVVHRVGPLPALADIDKAEVYEAFRFDKKRLAGSLQMVLLKGIGKPAIISEKDIPQNTAKRVLGKLLDQAS